MGIPFYVCSVLVLHELDESQELGILAVNVVIYPCSVRYVTAYESESVEVATCELFSFLQKGRYFFLSVHFVSLVCMIIVQVIYYIVILIGTILLHKLR